MTREILQQHEDSAKELLKLIINDRIKFTAPEESIIITCIAQTLDAAWFAGFESK